MVDHIIYSFAVFGMLVALIGIVGLGAWWYFRGERER